MARADDELAHCGMHMKGADQFSEEYQPAIGPGARPEYAGRKVASDMQRGLTRGRIPESRRVGDCTHVGDAYISTSQLGQH